MRIDHSIDRSRLWLQVLGGAAWFGGAGMSAAWMLHAGGVIRPLALFAVWAMGVCFVTIRALDTSSDTIASAKKAMRYGSYSVVVLALGTLFFEYWPVTVSMAFMFAICRTCENEDTPAYN